MASLENIWSLAHLELAILLKVYSKGEILKSCILIVRRNHFSGSLFWIVKSMFLVFFSVSCSNTFLIYKKTSSRRESFRGTSYRAIVFSTIFSEWCSKVFKDRLWIAASAIRISKFWWKMLIPLWLDKKYELMVEFL